MMKFVRYWGPVCGYAGLIFFLSSQSHPEETLPTFVMFFSDKVLHFVEYSVLGGLWYRAIRWGTTDTWSRQAVPIAIVLTSLYGASDEIHQSFVPFRESSGYDWIADTIGAVFGTMVARHMMKGWSVTPVPEVVREP